MDTEQTVLKEGETFAVFDAHGDIIAEPDGTAGLFFRDTRHLSHAELRINHLRPVPLSSSVGRDDMLLRCELSNPEFGAGNERHIKSQTLHLSRRRLLWRDACLERLQITNHSRDEVGFSIQYIHDADFADIFEVRGAHRPLRGKRLPVEVVDGCVTLSYQGLDERTRTSRITFDPLPELLSPTSVVYTLSLGPGESRTFYITVDCSDVPGPPASARSFDEAVAAAHQARNARRANAAVLGSSNELFTEWLNRSAADTYMLVSDTEHGSYPVAGIPWFSTPFGRDALVTALQCLWCDPSIARGVLAYLAATQASEHDVSREAEPGKILHETRACEMAELGEVPFARYYGTVDATPLFIVLAGAWFQRTGDLAFLEHLWPNIDAALGWMDNHGDIDGDGFIEYERHTQNGLVNQGWKDSDDAISHADGRLAEGAIALVEVQAYAYMARLAAARIASELGYEEQARTLRDQSEELRHRFEETFWSNELGTYVLALDGDKRACKVRSSNAGHALFAGIASPERARCVVDTLMSADSFSGWGIRTLDARERRYNPMSYHNGSIWPHDNGIIAMGFERYGFRKETLQLLTALFDSSLFTSLHRLPELYCGFERSDSPTGPVRYPSACAPQAWASSTAFALIGATLGIRIDAAAARVTLCRPRLPGFLDSLHIRGLTLGEASVDLICGRHRHDVSVNVLERSGNIRIVVES